jgi:invasion protein IalB
VLPNEGNRGPVAVVSVPRTVYLAPGIELKVDNGQGFKLLYETCNDQGCHAGYRVTGDIATALKKGQIAAHKIFDSAQKPTVLNASLKGFGKALDRLAEVSK